jgi:hypothetical protein
MCHTLSCSFDYPTAAQCGQDHFNVVLRDFIVTHETLGAFIREAIRPAPFGVRIPAVGQYRDCLPFVTSAIKLTPFSP